ncbi:MAG: hypothetical protein GC134_08600 [Proteobacteria bacterium]|nr:hypothetical protein [Pseudomonadota bacterium]
MNKWAVFSAFFALVALIFMATMHVKNDVQALRDKRDRLVERQMRLNESMRVLQAEYTYLSRPERLRQFASVLNLAPVGSMQVVPLTVAFDGGQP